MSSLKLKEYQNNALTVLSSFLEKARYLPQSQAFKETVAEFEINVNHFKPSELGEIPYICLRLPTGGGKTLLATHAIHKAAHHYLDKSYPFVLWLAPTTTICSQTIEALQNPNHPYRIELNNLFGNKVVISSIDNAATIQPYDIGKKVIIIVSTFANPRVKDTVNRGIYDHKEIFSRHFQDLTPQQIAHLDKISQDDIEKSHGFLTEKNIGEVKWSFANLVMLHRPLVIIDEAHNARTPLTLTTLKRFAPACIIEFTATPDKSSNVIYHVSASELKEADMIKLPIILKEHHDNWESAIKDAVLQLEDLSKVSQHEKEYIRPIALFQADNKNGLVPVEKLKDFLINECNVSNSEIAIATGTQRELDNINLFDKKTTIRYIITVQALKEGWDCSFAYVFCSTQKVNSNKDAEQLLGRVLRMPYATRRNNEKLNKAYAHLNSPNFAQAAAQIKDALIKDMGFEGWEADTYIEQATLNTDIENNQTPVCTFILDEPLEDLTFSETEKQAIEITQTEDNRFEIKITGEITPIVETAILNTVKEAKKQANIKYTIQGHNNRYYAKQAPSERGEVFKKIPYLEISIQERLVLLEADTFLRLAQWDISTCPLDIAFTIEEKDSVFSIDINGKKIIYDFENKQQSLDYDALDCPVNESDFAIELDQIIRNQRQETRINQEKMLAFLIKVINYQQNHKGNSLTALWRHKFLLIKAILNKLDNHRENTAQQSFQQLLFSDEPILVASQRYFFDFKPNYYPFRKPYQGSFRFKKHFYPQIDDLKEGSEEFQCAQEIDRHDNVKHWIRNLVQPESAFWLPLSNGRFYPDFVVELHDGRSLIVEYKGKHLIADSQEKLAIGKAFAKATNSLFLMAVKQDEQGRTIYQQIMDTIKLPH